MKTIKVISYDQIGIKYSGDYILSCHQYDTQIQVGVKTPSGTTKLLSIYHKIITGEFGYLEGNDIINELLKPFGFKIIKVD